MNIFKYYKNTIKYVDFASFMKLTLLRVLGKKSRGLLSLNCIKTDIERPLYIRKGTTDVRLVLQLLLRDGEYDFLYNEKYLSKLKAAKVIVDAGANIGIFSRICKCSNAEAKIIAIEPESSNLELLQKNLDDGCVIMKNGLWSRNSKLSVIPSDEGNWAFTVKETTSDQYDVSAICVEDIFNGENIDFIDIFKIDIEGSEFEVFNKDATWLDKVGMIILEIHEEPDNYEWMRLFKLMQDHDFSYERFSENFIFTRE